MSLDASILKKIQEEEQYPNRKTERLQNLLYALKPYLKRLDIQLITYDAFAQLEKRAQLFHAQTFLSTKKHWHF